MADAMRDKARVSWQEICRELAPMNDTSRGQMLFDAALTAVRAEENAACAKIAAAHKGAAARKRREKFPDLMRKTDPDTAAEIGAEERGEDIAAEVIAAAIRQRSAP